VNLVQNPIDVITSDATETTIDLSATVPAAQKNRAAYAIDHVARTELTQMIGFSPAKLRQCWSFDRKAGTCTFTARYSTAL
jgi:hypothetical protein